MSQSAGLYLTRTHDASPDKEYEVKYAVIADTPFEGELQLGDSLSLTVWELTNARPGEDRWLCLRVRYTLLSNHERLATLPSPRNMSKTQRQRTFYHAGGVLEETIALASLFLRRRLRLGPTVRWHGRPIMFPPSRGVLDEALITGKGNLSELGPWLDLVEGLPKELHLPFILAARLYQQALELLDTKPDFAYLNLVSAIEALSNRTKIAEPTIEDYDPDLATLLKQIDNAELRARIEQRTLDHLNEGKIGLRFVQFITDHVDDSFWETDRPTAAYGNGRVEPTDLPALMKRVYDQRSKTLHEGRAFPGWVFEPPYDGVEMPIGIGMSWAGGVWSQEDFFPYPHFMERLVRHVLISFLRRNQQE